AAPTVAQAPRTPEPERALDSQGVMKPDGALESEALPAAGAEAQTASTSSTPPLQARVAPAAQGAAPALSTGAGAVVEESAPVEPAGAAPRSAAPSAPSEPAPTEVPEAAAPDAAMPEAPASTSAAPVPAADSRAVARPVTATAPLTAQQRPAEPLAAEPPAAQPPPEGLPSEAEPVPAVPPVSSSAPSRTADSSAPHEPATPTREPAAAPRLASDDEAAEAAAGEAQAPAGEPVAVQEPQDSLAAFAPLPAPPKAASPAPAARTRDRDSDPEPTAASPESLSERDILLEGASSLTRPPRRTASHWAGVLLALVLLPVAWFLVNDGARALTGGDATAWPAAVSMQGVLELGAGALLLCLALLMAHRSSLGALVLGGISLLIGLPFVVAPGAVASLLGPTVERLQAHSELGEALATYAMTDGLTGRFALMGLVIIMVGLVAHTSRRAGRREQAAAEQNNEGSTSLDFLLDERS
ncbi:MAG: hypothetical protein Q4E00_01540, partial [Actinomyces bowdenii]|nr:hypothetical protein [Actinomyces bowdenii]